MNENNIQAGVVLETLDSALADQGMMVPLDLGAKVLMRKQKLTTKYVAEDELMFSG